MHLRRDILVWAATAAFATSVLLAAIAPRADAHDEKSGGAAPPVVASPVAGNPWSRESLASRFPPPDAKAAPEAFAGTSSCKECHEDRVASLATSFHEAMRSEKKSGTRGCEACHGPGQAHADEAGDAPIRQPATAKPKESLGTCLACHFEVLSAPDRGHRDWILAKDGSPRSCTTCHDIHVDRKSAAFDESAPPFTDKKALDAAAKPVDPARCSVCHTSFHPQMAKSGHAFLLREGAACAVCHGNGSLHAESGGRRTKILRPDRLPAASSNALCMDCHRSGESVARWTCSEHAREGVSCVACHDPNAARGRTLRGASEFELCGGCHADVKAKFMLPNRHRVESGRMKCSDCHDPHGNTSKMRDADLRVRSCGACHDEKTQPFLFDHGIKRSEGCTACHDPHGSTNRRMLTHDRIKPLCLQCHPESPHDLSQRRFDNCIGCHSEIHGSDLDRNFRR